MTNNEILPQDIVKIETSCLLDAIYRRYGYDFSGYASPYIERTICSQMQEHNIGTVSQFQHELLYKPICFEDLFAAFSNNVTELFRDPSCFLALRTHVVPLLKTYPSIRIWHAGCSSGEEVYSLAIILKEEGLWEKTQVFATDFNKTILNHAESGKYPSAYLEKFQSNYSMAGGTGSLENHFTKRGDNIFIDEEIHSKITFIEHNLCTDGSLGEMHLILCRNVLIYFNDDLQSKVTDMMFDSLCLGGFLCLGPHETFRSSYDDSYSKLVVKGQKIYAKKKKTSYVR